MHDIVSVKKRTKNEWEVRVALPDFLGLLSAVTGLFASSGMSVQRGRIRTFEKKALDVFHVTSEKAPDWDRFKRDLADLAGKARQGRIAEVRADINARIMEYLRSRLPEDSEKLYPIELEVDQKSSPAETVLAIRAPDTPAFLYELTNALSLLGINIVRMEIDTKDGEVRDRIWVTSGGGKITSKEKLRVLQWAVLLIKRFTHLLPGVPDPAAALDEIVVFGKEIFERDDFDAILLSLKKSRALEDLSRVLGTSRYLWEEFIRSQHEPIHKILGDAKILRGRKSRAAMETELRRALAGPARSPQAALIEKIEALNAFKDREMFRIDLRHLLGKTSYLEEFAEEFTDLAETVVSQAYAMAWKETARRQPRPKVSAKTASEGALLALGKFGGRELGYASDLELMLVYTDDPDGNSSRSRNNQRFYSELVQIVSDAIRARREGVFEIDWRLRPYGKAGAPAVSLELFKSYYSDEGKARNFERQALVKLRYVAGSEKAGKQVERLRDRYVFGPKPFDFREAAELRDRQRTEIASPGTLNAKYGAGGLIDAEYLVQTLQIVHGSTRGARSPQVGDIRSPNTLKALAALKKAGAVTARDADRIRTSYIFLRDLINALRIFRGNAKDLGVPAPNSREYAVLARRMGYAGRDSAVRRDFERDLSGHMKSTAVLYRTTMAALERLGSGKAAPASERGELTRAAPDPGMALEYLDKYAEAAKEAGRKRPSGKELAALLTIFGTSRYLSEIILADPDCAGWLGDERALAPAAIRRGLSAAPIGKMGPPELRRFRHRETLRIAASELHAGTDVEEIFSLFTELADRILARVFTLAFGAMPVCAVALGKLGGHELNYSSDLDLMFISGTAVAPTRAAAAVNDFLRMATEGGPHALYRIDLRLRPHANQGSLCLGMKDYLHYYRSEADAWEYQAMLKARPAAGAVRLGRSLLRFLDPLIYRRAWPKKAVERLREVKRRYEEETREKGEEEANIKMGPGGIRDAEFTVQMIQLLNGARIPALKGPSTLCSLREIRRRKLLTGEECRALEQNYLLMRRIENRLQLYENRQTFTLPAEPARLRALAKSLGFEDGPEGGAEERFLDAMGSGRRAVREVFEKIFFGKVGGLAG